MPKGYLVKLRDTVPYEERILADGTIVNKTEWQKVKKAIWESLDDRDNSKSEPRKAFRLKVQ